MLRALRIPVLPSVSPPLSAPRLASSRKDHPAVHRRGAPLTSTAGFDPHRVGGALDNIAQPDLFVGDEAREPHFVRPRLRLVSRSGMFVLHTAPHSISLSFKPWTLPGNLPRRSARAARWRSAAVLQPASRRTSLPQRSHPETPTISELRRRSRTAWRRWCRPSSVDVRCRDW